MKRTERTQASVHLGCEVCAEKSVMSIPRQRAPVGIVDCPCCGTAYLVILEPREDVGPPGEATPPRTTA